MTQQERTLAVIPCHNEQVAIGSVVLRTRKHVDTVLVIDDGCSDHTTAVAQEAGAVVLSHNKNKGKSDSIRTGFSYALSNGYDYVVTLDGDGQHNPDEIPVLLEPLVSGQHDISIGFRTGKNTEMPLWRKMGKRTLDYATSIGNGGFVTDSQCGFRAFNKKAVSAITPRLHGRHFVVESEQLVLAHDLGLRVTNANITCRYRELTKTSTKHPASHGFSVLNQILTLVAVKRPLLFIGVPGLFLLLVGLYEGISTLQQYNQTHIFAIDNALVVGIVLIVGTLALFIGLTLNVLPGILRRLKGD
jgi:glycosyltransferase involved in cell wall biosynthesis